VGPRNTPRRKRRDAHNDVDPDDPFGGFASLFDIGEEDDALDTSGPRFDSPPIHEIEVRSLHQPILGEHEESAVAARHKTFIEETIRYIRHLEEKQEIMLAARQTIRGELEIVKRAIEANNTLLAALQRPAYFVGTVEELLPDGRAAVRFPGSPLFIVDVTDALINGPVRVGWRVACARDGYTILEVLDISPESGALPPQFTSPTDPIDYNAIGGYAQQIEDLREVVELPLTNPARFRRLGVIPPRGVLLHGAPGTGKTLVARAVASSTGAKFFHAAGPEFVNKYSGEGTAAVKELFRQARAAAPSIIFIDELDAIGSRRGDTDDAAEREVQRTMLQILAELDGFEERGDVRVIGATNRFEDLDPAFVRPGRFDRLIEFPVPDLEARHQILQVHARPITCSSDVSLIEIARVTEGCNGAELRAVVMEAGMIAVRLEREAVTQADFVQAVARVRKAPPVRYEDFESYS
jgi:proteasome regulatory subunit